MLTTLSCIFFCQSPISCPKARVSTSEAVSGYQSFQALVGSVLVGWKSLGLFNNHYNVCQCNRNNILFFERTNKICSNGNMNCSASSSSTSPQLISLSTSLLSVVQLLRYDSTPQWICVVLFRYRFLLSSAPVTHFCQSVYLLPRPTEDLVLKGSRLNHVTFFCLWNCLSFPAGRGEVFVLLYFYQNYPSVSIPVRPLRFGFERNNREHVVGSELNIGFAAMFRRLV